MGHLSVSKAKLRMLAHLRRWRRWWWWVLRGKRLETVGRLRSAQAEVMAAVVGARADMTGFHLATGTMAKGEEVEVTMVAKAEVEVEVPF